MTKRLTDLGMQIHDVIENLDGFRFSQGFFQEVPKSRSTIAFYDSVDHDVDYHNVHDYYLYVDGGYRVIDDIHTCSWGFALVATSECLTKQRIVAASGGGISFDPTSRLYMGEGTRECEVDICFYCRVIRTLHGQNIFI